MRRSFKFATIIAVMFLAVTVASGSLISHAEAAAQPSAQLGVIEYPVAVRPGSSFQINVNAWYSGKFLADLGVWDRDSGLMVQSMTFISQFIGPGNVNFTISLTAPDEVGSWNLLVVNRVWWQNAWYQDPIGGEESFTVLVAKNVILTLGSQGAPTEISVDGQPYQFVSGSFDSISLLPGSHILEAPRVIQQSASERFVFDGWSDGVASDPYTLLLTGPLTVYAQYRTEYYLSTQSQIGAVVGGGWYVNGATATVAVPPTVASPNSLGFVNEYQFSSWSGDSTFTGNVVTVVMNGPKQLTANWVNRGTSVDSRIVANILLILCVLLFGRLVFLWSKRSVKEPSEKKGRKASIKFVCIFLILLLVPLTLAPVQAQSVPSPRASIVHIGDANWYYWNQSGSDTCLIWLGGGIPEVSAPGAYGYLVNPYYYESFDTIRFIQDLTRFYCVIALQQGSVKGVDSAANRTIYQELFQPQVTTIEQIHQWILGRGYVHTFVVGYSVGGQAAAADLTLSHPSDWTTQDGLILITVPFSQDVIMNAKELRTNLLLMYGGNLPYYEASGIQFYNNTQAEGFHAGAYFHKEFRVLNDAGHEVWTIRATGTYDTVALDLIVGFIERSKTLQLLGNLPSVTTNSMGHTTAQITSAQLPAVVRPGEPFLIDCNVTAERLVGQPMILAAFDTGDGSLLSQVRLFPPDDSNVRLVVVSGTKATQMQISIVILQKSVSGWVQGSNPYSAAVSVTDLTSLTVQTTYPGVGFLLDGKQFTTNSTGLLELQIPIGEHLLQAHAFVYESNASRLRFVGWGDSMRNASREIQLPEDSLVEISYVQQYLVQVNSPYGRTIESGWHDANSTVMLMIQPPLLNSPPVIFSHWNVGANQSTVTPSMLVSSPIVVSAVWNPLGGAALGSIYGDPWFILSLLAFIVLSVLNVKAVGRRRDDSSG